MRVAVAQFATTLNVQENLATCIRMITETAVCEPSLIVLPEYCNSLYCNVQPSYLDHNQAWNEALAIDGEFLRSIGEQAKKYACYIVINVTLQRDLFRDHSNSEKNCSIKSNISVTSCLFSPQGKLINQEDKQTLTGHENDFFISASTASELVTTSFGMLGLLTGSDGMTYEFIAEDHVYPACSPQLIKEFKFKEPKDILNFWLVSLENQGRIDWPTWFKEAGVKNYQDHKKWTEVSTGDMALSAVLSGHGFTLASQALFSQYVNTGQLVIPFNIKHPISFKRYFVFDPNSAKKSRLDVFTAWLKEETQLDEQSTLEVISHARL